MALPSATEYLRNLMDDMGLEAIDGEVLSRSGMFCDVKIIATQRTLKAVPAADHVLTDRLVPGALCSLSIHHSKPYIVALHTGGSNAPFLLAGENQIPTPSLQVTVENTGYRLNWFVANSSQWRYEVFGNDTDDGLTVTELALTYKGVTNYLHTYDGTLVWFAVRCVADSGEKGPLSAWVTAEVIEDTIEIANPLVTAYEDYWQLDWGVPVGYELQAMYYKIYWAEDGIGAGSTLIHTTATGTSAILQWQKPWVWDYNDYTYFQIEAYTADDQLVATETWFTDTVALGAVDAINQVREALRWQVTWDYIDGDGYDWQPEIGWTFIYLNSTGSKDGGEQLLWSNESAATSFNVYFTDIASYGSWLGIENCHCPDQDLPCTIAWFNLEGGPSAPQNFAIEFGGAGAEESYVLTWQPPTEGLMWKYQIWVADDASGTNAEYVGQKSETCTTTPCTLTEIASLNADPNKKYYKIIPWDTSGVEGTGTAWVRDLIDPVEPTSMSTAHPGDNSARINYGYPANWDFTKTYAVDIYLNTSATLSGAHTLETDYDQRGGDQDYLIAITYSDIITYGDWVGLRSKDHYGNVGASDVVWFQMDPIVLSSPASLTVANAQGGFEVNWEPSPETGLVDYYEVQWASDAIGTDAETAFEGNTLSKFDAADDLHTYFRVRAVALDGSTSGWTAWTNDPTPPPNASGLSSVNDRGGGWLQVDLATDTSADDEGFRRWQVWVSDSPSGTSPTFHSYMLLEQSSNYWIDQLPYTHQYYAIKAEDWAGNLSVAFSSWEELYPWPLDYGPVDERWEEYANNEPGNLDGLGLLVLDHLDTLDDFSDTKNAVVTTDTYTEGAGGVKLTTEVPNGADAAYIEKTVSWDLTADGRFQDDGDAIVLWGMLYYASSGASDIRLYMRLETDASNYYETYWDGFIADPQFAPIYWPKGDFSATGSPSWANITKWKLSVNTTWSGAITTIYIDDIRLVKGTDLDGSSYYADVDETVGNWTGDVYRWFATGAYLEAKYHVTPGLGRGQEPDQPYSLGCWDISYEEDLDSMLYVPYPFWHEYSEVGHGVIAAGFYFTEFPQKEFAVDGEVHDGYGAIFWNCHFEFFEASPGSGLWESIFDMYGAEISRKSNKIRLFKWVDSTKTKLGEVAFTTSLYTPYWLGVDFRDPDGLIKVYVTAESSATVFRGENLVLTATDTSVARNGPVGLKMLQTRCLDFRAGSPAHAMSAEYAYQAAYLDGITVGADEDAVPTAPRLGHWHFREDLGIYQYWNGVTWVDVISATGLLPLFLYDDASADVGGYKLLSTDHSTAAKSNEVFSSLGSGDTLLEEWVTDSTGLGLHFLSDGTYHLHVHAKQTATTGYKDVQLYVEVYKRASGGSETLLCTTDRSSVLTTVEAEYDTDTFSPEVDLDLTDRIAVKLYATVTGSGAAPEVTIYMEGDTFGRLEIPAPGGSSGGGGESGDDTLPWLGGIF